MISWFVLKLELSTRLQNTGQCIYSEWKTLENQSANLCLYVSLKELSQSIFFFGSEEGFQVRTALSLFTINTPCQLPSHCELWHLTAPNHHTHITIEPIVRCVRKSSHISLQLCWTSERALVHSFADGLHKWFRQCVGRLQSTLCSPSTAPFWLSIN